MDFEKVLMLLDVVRGSRDYPNLKVIHDAAMYELQAMTVVKPPSVRRMEITNG